MSPGIRLASLLFVLSPLASSAAVDYQTQVFPLLKNNCFECHGGPKAKRDIRMDIPAKFQEQIGKEGVIVPGKPQESRLIEVLELPYDDEYRMPRPGPHKNEPLKPQDIAIIKTWIAEGASFEKQDGAVADAPAPTEPSPDLNAVQAWTSTSGTEIKAYFVRLEGENVVLKSEDGQEKAFPMAVFSEASQALVKKLAEVKQ